MSGEPRRPERPRPSLVSSALQTYGTNLLVAVLSLVNVLVVARVLGASGRGEVVFLITVASMSGYLAGCAIQEANGNLGAREAHLRPALASNSVLFALVLGTIGALVVAGVTEAFPSVGGPVSRSLLLIALACIPLLILRVYLSFLVQAEYAFHVSNAAWLAGPSTTAVLNATLALAGGLSVESAFGVWVLGQAVGVTILATYVARHAGFGRPDRRVARESFSFGIRAQVKTLMDIGNYRADQWILGAIAGATELGVYSVAVAWAEMLYYLPGVLVLVQRPDVARATREAAGAFASRVFRAAVVLAAILAAGLVLVAPLLCTVVFGDEFADATPMLRVLALGAVGLTALELLSSALVAQRHPLLASVGIAVAAATGIALDFVLIPDHGGMGASVAAVAGASVGGVVTAVLFTRTLGAPMRGLVPRPGELRGLAAQLRARVARSGAA